VGKAVAAMVVVATVWERVAVQTVVMTAAATMAMAT
jgi:hypothetical protein